MLQRLKIVLSLVRPSATSPTTLVSAFTKFIDATVNTLLDKTRCLGHTETVLVQLQVQMGISKESVTVMVLIPLAAPLLLQAHQ